MAFSSEIVTSMQVKIRYICFIIYPLISGNS
jgi:hypothetical protein